MARIISLLIIVALSLVFVRVGANALMMTGLSSDTADFQAYSAFFGVGFTTSEAELVVNHPVRRRIIKHLILLGNLGLTAGLGSVIVAFVKAEGPRGELDVLLWIGGGLGALAVLALTPPVRLAIDWLIRSSLKASGVIHPADFALLLQVHAGYVVEEVGLGGESPLAGRMLKESLLGSRGVVVLGVSRSEPEKGMTYFGAPTGSFRLLAGDTLTVYGLQKTIADVIKR